LNNEIPEEVLREIESYAKSIPQEESCGVIALVNNNLSFIPCENLSENRYSNFFIDPNILIDNNVVYIYHSHVDQSSKPSFLDIKSSKSLCIPYLIYSLRDEDFYLHKCV
jgi:proteasome lid subunit RPN8/RPN11